MKTYKQKIIEELESIPDEMMPQVYRIFHVVMREMKPGQKHNKSLRGIWINKKIDETLINEAKDSLFSYESK